MTKTIAIDDSLTSLKKRLEREGYKIVDMDKTNLKNVDAVIVNSIDDNIMGIQNTYTKSPVVSADGLDHEEVIRELKNKGL
ncbi:MAG: hypothetical protein PWQ82_318 [Thermosediminibacterales bacterium]|nr:hypothetical protein [Thermosediminibacterales bacterium]MDK2836400.1 hypothetical protein [Thermosediminibacterales bacterium]